ncbi:MULTISPECIES: type I-F CRISPR-associated protein Csy3 [Vibrio]|uniref:type I-F CRISPR-associated protein Csy3 n=1 Tax=Vibrio TaxID=662 RepID=UPI000E69B935|nr:type I-F CRISPR-associated protein Csy3 [Vibrio sp. PID23_8]RIZ51532.1 CRISPR-associated protein Csy3 [Vibrio sp. PID23_8]
MELPTNLAYERSINPSDVCFFVVWPDGTKEPLTYTSRTVLGQMETASLAYDSTGSIKDNATAETLAHGNPHTVDFCNLPFAASHIECFFSVSFSSELRKPYKCNSNAVKDTLIKLIKLYEKRIGWQELVTRYLANICNGSWLWKNTKKAYRYDVELTPWPWSKEAVLFEDIRANYAEKSAFEAHQQWSAIRQLVVDAFSQSNGLAIFEVKATLVLPTNSEIYPSQAFTEKENKITKKVGNKDKARTFQNTQIENAHSPIIGLYKVGAAIATIDDWYPNALEPLRVSRFGAHKGDVTCYRHPSTEKDLFTILQNAEQYIERLSAPGKLSQELTSDLHYLVANLIKGGMFQHKGD